MPTGEFKIKLPEEKDKYIFSSTPYPGNDYFEKLFERIDKNVKDAGVAFKKEYLNSFESSPTCPSQVDCGIYLPKWVGKKEKKIPGFVIYEELGKVEGTNSEFAEQIFVPTYDVGSLPITNDKKTTGMFKKFLKPFSKCSESSESSADSTEVPGAKSTAVVEYELTEEQKTEVIKFTRKEEDLDDNLTYFRGASLNFSTLLNLHKIRIELSEIFETLNEENFIVTGSFLIKRILELNEVNKSKWENNDLDIFPFSCDNSKILKMSDTLAIKYPKKLENTQKYISQFGPIDFVFDTSWSSAKDVLHSFDMTICMVGITKDKLYFHKSFSYALEHKLLRFMGFYGLKRAIDRIQKYTNRGFSTDSSTVNSLIGLIELYQTTFGSLQHTLADDQSSHIKDTKFVTNVNIGSYFEVPFNQNILESIKSLSIVKNKIEENDYSFLEI